MPRYEFSEGSSNKFWEITLEGNAFTTTYGKIGTDGQSTVKEWPSEAEAKKQYDKLVAEKVKKGYQLVGGEGPSGGGGGAEQRPAKGGAKKGGAAENRELEDAIVANPDDLDAYAVYADWLQSQGDPRGELGAVQVAIARNPGAKDLKAREKALLDDHKKFLLGKLGEDDEQVKVTWRGGHIHTARVAVDYDAEEDGAALVKQLLALPAARLLADLTVGLVDTEGENDYGSTIKAIAAAPPRALRRLFLGDFQYGDETEMSWSHLGDVSKLYGVLPHLETLILQSGASIKLGAIDLPKLKHFEIRTGGLDKKSIKAIATAKWPSLETLIVWFGSSDYGFDGGVKDIRPILDGAGIPKVTHLGLMNAEFTDELCGELAGAKVVRQLAVLDLSMGTMTSRGAKALADGKQAFAHLQKLNVEENLLGDGDKKLLAAAFGKALEYGDQRRDYGDDDEGRRYVAVGE